MAAKVNKVAIISWPFISCYKLMSEFQYSNNRDILEGNNFLTDFRPSGYLRMLKFPLEYGLLQAALTYGIMYDGFGFHAYYLQRTGAPINSPPGARLKLISFTFAKYFAVSLPFFYFKEVFCSLTYIATREKPRIRKAIDYAFLQNIFAFAATFPFFYMIQKNMKKSMRGCVVLTAFSMLNDMIIETKRKGLLMRGMSYDEIMSNRINENLEFLKETIESVDPMVKHRLASISWDTLKDDVLMNRKKLSDPQELQKEQIDLIASALREEFKYLHKYFD